MMQFSKRTIPQWFEEHQGEFQHVPCPAQAPPLNIIELLWSVLETTVSNSFPLPTSLKQLEDALNRNGIKFC
jgi:hypothetical protein